MSGAATVTSREEERTLQKELTLPILLADRVIKSAYEAESAKQDCSDLAKQVDRLSHMLRSTVRLTNTTNPIYDRPLLCIASYITKNLERALSLVRKCKHSGILRHVFSITTTADFRKVSNLLESSIGDMRWLLSILESEGGTHISLPPIASNDPIIAWVWSFISTVHMGPQPKDRIDAANELASLARDSDRNKKMIVEEGGILPLLKLLKDGPSPEAQISAAKALHNIATDQERVRSIAYALGVPIIVAVLGASPVKVQIVAANLVARMAGLDFFTQGEFVTENVIRPLVLILSTDLDLEVINNNNSNQPRKASIHSLVQMNKELRYKNTGNSNNSNCDGNSNHRKEREVESPQVQLKLKVSCAEALWKLSSGSLSSCRRITETKGLLCLAKIIEKEKGELQLYCLSTIMEITAVAESDTDLRRAAFKTNWPPAMAVLDQLLRLVQEECAMNLQIPAIRSIGCLARTFPARETRIIRPLVARLSSMNLDLATEAAIALGKFVCPDNFNCSEHSKTIIEFDGIPPLMSLIRRGDRAQTEGLTLLCYLALNAGNSKALEQARALNAIEALARPVIAQQPELRDLFAKAIHHLTLYQAGIHPNRQPFAL